MFIGENLTNLRTMHGYSRKQLSEKLGVSEQAVWQYENSYISPKMPVVNELKKIFQVKSKYFYTQDMLVSEKSLAKNIEVKNIAYRSKVLNVISKTQSEVKHVEYLDIFVNYITEKLSLPTLQIIKLRDEAIRYLNNSDEEKVMQINHVAKLAREYLGLENNTNDNLLYLIEKSGVFVFEKAIGAEIDAYSLWTNNNRPFIILGNLKKSSVRRNFDIAHELGHLLLHYRLEFNNLDRKEHKSIEKEADMFAGAFLLPEKEFSFDMNYVKYKTDPDAFVDLKKKWQTSLQVLAYRASNLGIIEAKEHRNFYAAMHRKGYLKIEPLDDTIKIQKPQKAKSIIDFASKNRLINIRQMLETDWKVETSFFYQLTGIDSNFFNNYLRSEFDFNLKSVTDIAKVKENRLN